MQSGIDYFPLDVVLDDKFALVEAEFGLTGFAVVVKLLQRIYGQCGYYCEWTNEVALLFAHRVGLGWSVVSEIVAASTRRGLFDGELLERYQILTSAGIQKRYFEIVKRRKSVEVKEAYLLLPCDNLPSNVHILSENVYRTTGNVYRNGQSKVKERKVKKRESACNAPARACGFAVPTLEEIREFCSRERLNVNAEKFNDYYTANGWRVGKNKMKDWKAAARNWSRREKEFNKGRDYEEHVYLDGELDALFTTATGNEEL